MHRCRKEANKESQVLKASQNLGRQVEEARLETLMVVAEN